MRKQINIKAYILFTGIVAMALSMGCKTESKKKQIKEVLEVDVNLGAMIQPIPEYAVHKDSGYNVWGGSVVKSEDGTYHMFYARWPYRTGFQGWLKDSDIAYATAASATGPYTFKKVLLTGFGKGHWNEEAAHNPHIKKFDNKYYLYFISHKKEDLGLSDWMNHIFTQRIGVAIADNPAGPWEVLPEPLIDYQEGKPAHGYMVNPSVVKTPEGKYLMMFKARKPGAEKSGKFDPIHCLAVSDSPAGPFTIAEETLLTEATAEDPYVWYQNRKYYAVVKDMYAKYTGHKSLALFQSEDGLNWKPSENILVSKTEIVWEGGDTTKVKNLERPQILFDEKGNPEVLFCAVREFDTEGNDPKPTYNVHIPLKNELKQ
ncbi:glycoside hydrolase family protein [Zhouia spongiae]|uniref:Glycoside hydrolase family protein n=1 Tax=Zhouia spongiae TaxID=2202721 RepID=A0ABY3YIK2_9FLAO|nr:glycoside hydrolase family protein [Zhouia spongiae]UNY97481.1 glycoside hydrolase family protein [Zhouia spongiae]